MKKGIIVLLITVLAAGLVFADFSGDAYIQFNADLDNKNYGFANGSDFSFSFKIDSEVANVGGESPIHAVVEATANLIVAPTAGSKVGSAFEIWSNVDNGEYGLGLLLKVKTAKIVGDNWSVAINGAKSSAYNYASASALKLYGTATDDFGKKGLYTDYYYSTNPATYSVSYASAPGVTVTYDGFTGSFGFKHIGTPGEKETAGTAFSATFETKEFAFSDDMFKVQLAAEASKVAGKNTNIGVSAKAALAIEEVSVKVATDFGFENIGKDQTVNVQFDASLAAAYDFISATAYIFKGTALYDAYFELDDAATPTTKTSYVARYTGLYLEATLGADLSKFDVPVSVSFAAKNLVDKSDKGIALSASAKYSADAITAGTSFDIGLKDTAWTLNVYGIYAAEKFEAGANVKYDSSEKAVSFGAYAESSALIEGATLGLSYGLNNSYARNYGGGFCVAYLLNGNSFSSDATKIGTVGAYCIINF